MKLIKTWELLIIVNKDCWALVFPPSFIAIIFTVVLRAFAGPFGLSQELIQSERIFFFFFELHWAAPSGRTVSTAKFLRRNKPENDIIILPKITLFQSRRFPGDYAQDRTRHWQHTEIA